MNIYIYIFGCTHTYIYIYICINTYITYWSFSIHKTAQRVRPLDLRKLDSFGYGKGDGTDRLRFWKKVTCNRDKLSITVPWWLVDFSGIFGRQIWVLCDEQDFACLKTHDFIFQHEELIRVICTYIYIYIYVREIVSCEHYCNLSLIS